MTLKNLNPEDGENLKTPPTFSAKRPLHAQIRDLIKQKALSGELVDANGQLKTEAELVEHFGVSRVTIRNALAPLVESGMFDRTPGRGTFLQSNLSEKWTGSLMGFQEAIAALGFKPGAKILSIGMTNSMPDDVRAQLQERVVWQLQRIRFADETPIAIEHAFYPPDIGLNLETRDLVNIRMYEVLENELGFSIDSGFQTISSKLPTTAEKAALKLQPMSVLTDITRLTKSDGLRPLEFLHAVYRPDFFKFSIKLIRQRY